MNPFMFSVNSDNIMMYLRVLEDLGVRWNEGQLPTEFNPLERRPKTICSLELHTGDFLKFSYAIPAEPCSVVALTQEVYKFKNPGEV